MTVNQCDYKKNILSMLIPYFEKDERYFLLLCDTGFGCVNEFKEKLPDRVINIGIAEQATIGIAAGMAMSGMVPVVYGMCNFLVFRAFEQIRNDVVLQDQNVKIIGVGANNYFNFLGKSHTCDDDDIKLMKIANIRVFNPYVFKQCNFESMFDDFMESTRAGYLRI